ncbi:MAG: hypothetical protein AB7E37_02780 [Candidatus Altimarinota bacterium]
MFLNENIYKKFGLDIDLIEVQNGFKLFVKNLFSDQNGLLVLKTPDFYKESGELYKIQGIIKKEYCRQNFLDYSKYNDSTYGFGWLLDKLTEEKEFNKYIIKLQILLNIIYKEKFILTEYYNFLNNINIYLSDFPQLGLNLKIYKTKSAEFFPILSSKVLSKNIDNLLGILELDKYKNTINSFEEGLKIFLFSKTEGDLKNVIEDMLSVCDEFVKEFLGNKNKGFKHIFKDGEFEKFGLNKQNKEIFRTLRDYMDNIKHGTFKEYTKEDVEMIINLTVTFITFVINKMK